jgi:hypothetical protein
MIFAKNISIENNFYSVTLNGTQHPLNDVSLKRPPFWRCMFSEITEEHSFVLSYIGVYNFLTRYRTAKGDLLLIMV